MLVKDCPDVVDGAVDVEVKFGVERDDRASVGNCGKVVDDVCDNVVTADG